jgi:glycosyltransferase 2 family protein
LAVVMWRKVLQLAGGILIAGIGMWVFFRNVDIGRLWAESKTIPVWGIIGALLLSPLTIWFRSIRWRFLLPVNERANTKGLFSCTMIGFMVNNIFPARLGEAARALILWRKNRFTAAESIGSLIVERIIDTLVFLSFFFIPVFLLPKLHQLIGYALFFGAFFSGFVLMAAVYALFPGFTRSTAGKLLFLVPVKFRDRIIKITTEVVSNLNWLFSLKKVLLVLVFSYLITICYPCMILLLAHDVKSFGFLDATFSQAFAAFGAAIPLAPGYVGTLHAALLRGLIILGMQADKAGAITIIYHGLSFIIITLLGLIFFFSTKISMKDIEKAKKEMNVVGG